MIFEHSKQSHLPFQRRKTLWTENFRKSQFTEMQFFRETIVILKPKYLRQNSNLCVIWIKGPNLMVYKHKWYIMNNCYGYRNWKFILRMESDYFNTLNTPIICYILNLLIPMFIRSLEFLKSLYLWRVKRKKNNSLGTYYMSPFFTNNCLTRFNKR